MAKMTIFKNIFQEVEPNNNFVTFRLSKLLPNDLAYFEHKSLQNKSMMPITIVFI